MTISIEVENRETLEMMSKTLGIPIQTLCEGFVDAAVEKYAKSMKRVKQTVLTQLPPEIRRMVKVQ